MNVKRSGKKKGKLESNFAENSGATRGDDYDFFLVGGMNNLNLVEQLLLSVIRCLY